MTTYTVYLRIARSGKVVASQKPIFKSLESGSGYGARTLPTVQVALKLEIPNTAFAPAVTAIEIKNAQPIIEVTEL